MGKFQRKIPRDFFNESKLLKCMGHLALKIMECRVPNAIDIYIEENGEPFKIRLLDDSIYIKNYKTKVNHIDVIFKSTYNSKSAFPLHCQHGDEEILVFNEDGTFTEDFIDHFKVLPS